MSLVLLSVSLSSVLSSLFLCAGAPQAPAGVQEARSERDVLPIVFSGTVLTPEGRPARGAWVETSAGGGTTTGRDGSFALAVPVPDQAGLVDVTATSASGARDLAATVRILPSGPSASVGELLLAPTASCQARFVHTFGSQPGTYSPLYALVPFDDGSGAALYVGGQFSAFAGVAASSIARWDGRGWTALGEGVTGLTRTVHALVTFDDGGGTALYAAGNFANAGGASANRIARWDGTSWAPLGDGLNWIVRALAVFDDGSGAALYAGGEFTIAGGAPANRVARWDGTSWTALGSGLDGTVRALAVFDDGSGPALFVGGGFTSAGGVAASSIARWDGSDWTALGAGTNDDVVALAVFDDGGGPALFAGGWFDLADSVAADAIARWDGSAWSALGSGIGGARPYVYALTVFDDGGGPALHAGGPFTSAGGVTAHSVARWDGAAWSALGTGMDADRYVYALAGFDGGSGPALCAAGHFSTADGVQAHSFAYWRGAGWETLEQGLIGFVRELATFDDGSGPALYAGGLLDFADGVAVNDIARWDGAEWTALGGGITPGPLTPFPSVEALVVHDDGSGPALYAGGNFQVAGGIPVNAIARWDGAAWTAVGAGVPGIIYALASFDAGAGPELYTGGTATGQRWNGSTWTTYASGMGGEIRALQVFDDGSGPALYAGGGFTSAGGVAANHVARWDGAGWSALGGGMAQQVWALAVFDDGSGPALCAAGEPALGVSTIARWDGVSWTALGSGMGNGGVYALASFDDGAGAALFAAGTFTSADGLAANRIARWDGSGWSALGSGLSALTQALHVFERDGVAGLCVGGGFEASPARDSFLARWQCATKVRRAHW